MILENDNVKATRVLTDEFVGVTNSSSVRHIQGLLALQWEVLVRQVDHVSSMVVDFVAKAFDRKGAAL